MRKGEDTLEIDPLRLDEEWVGQPKLYLHYAKELADARRDLDLAKNELELTRAELDADIRADPSQYEFDGKPTEKAIEACILCQKRYKKANEEVISAKHAVDVFAAMVTALDHRKRALENLVDLHGQGYFAEPRAKREQDRESMREAKDKATMKRGQRPRKGKEDAE